MLSKLQARRDITNSLPMAETNSLVKFTKNLLTLLSLFNQITVTCFGLFFLSKKHLKRSIAN